EERQRLEELGVDVWLDRSDPHPARAAVEALGHELDGVGDVVGGQLEPSLPYVRVGGHAATIVDLSGDLELAIDRNIDLHGVLMRAGRARLSELAAEVAAGVRPHITDTYPLERAADAHRRLEAGRVGGKLVITLGAAAPPYVLVARATRTYGVPELCADPGGRRVVHRPQGDLGSMPLTGD